MPRSFTRARRPEQKEERREHLLATTRALLDEGLGLHELSLNEIGRRAGMAKANIYRYFESREAVLLALLWDEWRRWFERFSARRPAGEVTLEALVTRLARSFAREERLCALTAALPSVLEQNLGEEAIRTFKRDTLGYFSEVASYLASCCPALPAASYAELLNDGASAIVGLYPATHPAPTAAAVLAEAEFRFFRRDFGQELERFLRALAADHAARLPSPSPAPRPRRAAGPRAR